MVASQYPLVLMAKVVWSHGRELKMKRVRWSMKCFRTDDRVKM